MKIKWDNETRRARLEEIRAALALDRMPTASEMRRLPTGNALAVQLSRTGGLDGWADRMGWARAEHDSRKGWVGEDVFEKECRDRGLFVERSTFIRSPYDMRVNGLRVDVKRAAPGRYSGAMVQWTFRHQKKDKIHACDLFAMLCYGDNSGVEKIFIIPSETCGHTTTTITDSPSGKHVRYLNAWHQFSNGHQ